MCGTVGVALVVEAEESVYGGDDTRWRMVQGTYRDSRLMASSMKSMPTSMSISTSLEPLAPVVTVEGPAVLLMIVEWMVWIVAE
jgi:hypothetical protein